MTTATKTRKSPPPPKQEAWKSNPVNAEYDDKAIALLRYTMKIKGFSVDDLTAALNGMGVEISAGGLANKISRGGFNAAFLLQCMAAMDVNLAPPLK